MENTVIARISGGGQSNLSSLSGIGAGNEPFRAAEKRTIKPGFTLAEVLITLGIIGVVAAMTLPSLVSKYKDKELTTRAKKAYSSINQAVQLYQSKNGTPGDATGLWDVSKTSAEVAQEFSKYFNGVRYCKNKQQKGCAHFYDYKIKYNSIWVDENDTMLESDLNSYPKIILNDGTIIVVVQLSTCYEKVMQQKQDEYGHIIKDEDGNILYFETIRDYCSYVYFDTNGPQLPNQFGRDAFLLDGTTSGIVIQPWAKTGGTSLKSILSGGEMSYTDYKAGEKFDF